jgi:Ribonuclease P 40kDa (Rpp40) subunit
MSISTRIKGEKGSSPSISTTRLNQFFPRTMTVLSTTPPAFDDDRWCIDEYGVLTLSVCVETYRRLGLVGTKVQSASKKGLERRGAFYVSPPPFFSCLVPAAYGSLIATHI